MYYDCQATPETLAKYGVEEVQTRYYGQPRKYGDHIAKYFAKCEGLDQQQATAFFKEAGLVGDCLMDEETWREKLQRCRFPDCIHSYFKLREERDGWELTITDPNLD